MKDKVYDILLIEDNSDHAEIIINELKAVTEGNSNILLAHDGEEAAEILFESPSKRQRKRNFPDLIILDLKLPKISGLEILKRIKKDPILRVIPTVVLTTSTQASDIRSSYESGANSYVTKSVKFEKFIEKIQSIGMYWKSTNKEPNLNEKNL